MTVLLDPAKDRSLADQVAVVTGGTGVIGRVLTGGLVAAGARVAVLGRHPDRLEELVGSITAGGGDAIGIVADVTDGPSLVEARDRILGRWGRVDILVNAAGGNAPAATLTDGAPAWDLPIEGWRDVVALNLLGTVQPIQVFAESMVRPVDPAEARSAASIVNISSMAAGPVLTRVGAYGASKAAVENVTRWFAVELARRHGPLIRVNAIAPGFLIGDQNRDLLLRPDGELTVRGRTIIDHTPAGRFGTPDELVGALIWLCGPGSRFVTGIVVPVDGGFSAFSGV
jgi:Dehydrogenases with different specificities (related to short-chain alcohol dehydrogenases)